MVYFLSFTFEEWVEVDQLVTGAGNGKAKNNGVVTIIGAGR